MDVSDLRVEDLAAVVVGTTPVSVVVSGVSDDAFTVDEEAIGIVDSAELGTPTAVVISDNGEDSFAVD